MEGQLASVARALRDGFLAAHLHAQQAGAELRIELYDSSRMKSIDDFYRQARAAGVQLVVGPLEKDRCASSRNAISYLSPHWRSTTATPDSAHHLSSFSSAWLRKMKHAKSLAARGRTAIAAQSRWHLAENGAQGF